MKTKKDWKTDSASVFDAGAKVPALGGFHPPERFIHGATYWLMWTLATAVVAIWVVPPVAEFINRFVLRLW